MKNLKIIIGCKKMPPTINGSLTKATVYYPTRKLMTKVGDDISEIYLKIRWIRYIKL